MKNLPRISSPVSTVALPAAMLVLMAWSTSIWAAEQNMGDASAASKPASKAVQEGKAEIAGKTAAMNKAITPSSEPAPKPPATKASSAAIASAPAATSSPLRDLPLVIQAMMKKGKGVRFIDKFDAGSSMTGYVLAAGNGEQRIFYVTPDRKHAILGLMYDESLLNITAQHQLNHMDLTPHLPLEGYLAKQSLADIGRLLTPLVAEGKEIKGGQGNEVFVFADLASPEFQAIHKLSRAHLSSIRIKWMPVPNPSPAGLASQTALVAFPKSSDRVAYLFDLANPKIPGKKQAFKTTEVIEPTASPQLQYKQLKLTSVIPPAVAYFSSGSVAQSIQGVPTPEQWARIAQGQAPAVSAIPVAKPKLPAE